LLDKIGVHGSKAPCAYCFKLLSKANISRHVEKSCNAYKIIRKANAAKFNISDSSSLNSIKPKDMNSEFDNCHEMLPFPNVPDSDEVRVPDDDEAKLQENEVPVMMTKMYQRERRSKYQTVMISPAVFHQNSQVVKLCGSAT
jgi:phage FluMu protein Com